MKKSEGAARGMYLSLPGVLPEWLPPAAARWATRFGATQRGVASRAFGGLRRAGDGGPPRRDRALGRDAALGGRGAVPHPRRGRPARQLRVRRERRHLREPDDDRAGTARWLRQQVQSIEGAPVVRVVRPSPGLVAPRATTPVRRRRTRFVDACPGESDLAARARRASRAWRRRGSRRPARVLLSRAPPEPAGRARGRSSSATEPPAIANFLTHGFRVTDDAVPATLIDLAARNVVDIEQRGPGVFYVRLRPTRRRALTSYERRVLDHLRASAHDGVVPADALTTGPQHESARWRRGFVSGSSSDAQARGLSREAVGGPCFTLLTGAAAFPAALTWAAWDSGRRGSWFVGAVALLGWMKRQHPQRETPRGLEAASRWLGVRAELAENPVFATHSPLTGRALGPSPRVRSRARRRVGCEPPASDGRRAGHARRGRRTEVAGAVFGSRIRATGRPAGAPIRSSACSSASRSSPPRRSSCTRRGLVPRCRRVRGRPVRRCLHRRGPRMPRSS